VVPRLAETVDGVAIIEPAATAAPATAAGGGEIDPNP